MDEENSRLREELQRREERRESQEELVQTTTAHHDDLVQECKVQLQGVNTSWV